MPNKKITAMPSLAGNQVPTDLVTAVDLSAAPVNQNVKSTLNDIFAVITKNITDRAIRFQAPGSAPAVAAANQGALYHDGTAFLASSNGGAFEPLLSLSPQISTTVLIGPVAGFPNALPTFRALQFTDLPSTFAASIYGRNAVLDGSPQAIQSTAGVLNWLQTPSSANLSLAVTDGGTGTGALVLRTGPQIEAPYIDSIRVLTLPNTLGGRVIRFAQASGGGNNCVELVNAANSGTPILRAFGSSDVNVSLNLSSKGSGNITLSGAAIRAAGSAVTEPGIFEARGGNQPLGGGKILFYEQTTNGNNFVGFEAPDIISTSVYWTLPATDGTAGQVLSTNGAGILSWATRGTGTVTSVGLSAPSIFTISNSPVTGSGTLTLALAAQSQGMVFASPATGGAGTPGFRFLQTSDLPQLPTNTLLGRASAGSGNTEQLITTAAVLTWLQSATADNLRTAVTGDTGTGNLVFADAPTLTNVAVLNSSNGVPLTITNTGTGNSFVVEDESSDATPFVITSDGRILIGTTTGGLTNRMTFSGVMPINNTVSQIMSMIGVFDVGCSFGYGNGTRFSTNAGASLTQITHYGAFQGTFTGSVTNQIAFEVANLTGATNNFGLHSSITAGANRWAVYAIGGADSLFSGQVQFATGSAAAPSLTIQGDVNTGLAQIGGADTISISTGGTERLRAKSGGAIRFIPLTAAPASPESGDVYYNSTTNKLQVYNGTAWQDCN